LVVILLCIGDIGDCGGGGGELELMVVVVV
jgi:hypothetical protein